ncbi:MAG TPA: hypothetical protein VG479_09530 [Gaiellaceae bacterium]|jgi:hypothetical protein|nr:hypothetical protein [Gaiellaceae bacterium]
MSEDLSVLFDRLRELVDRRQAEPVPDVDDAERTLTDGYARALELERERLRVEGRIRELAGSAEHLDEARALSERLDRLDVELVELRELLGDLARTL